MGSIGSRRTAGTVYSCNSTAQRESNLAKVYEGRNARLSAVISGLSRDYLIIYYVNLETGAYEEYGNYEVYREKVGHLLSGGI